MKLSEIKSIIPDLKEINFILPNGQFVPKHFHVTEVGRVQKHFIDCGGVERKEEKISFQLWEAGDFDHRLAPEKLSAILSKSEEVLQLNDVEIEVEYQSQTIGKYDLSYESGNFLLVSQQTDCLAKDNCGIPESQLASSKPKVKLSSLSQSANSCNPDSGCC